MIASAKQLVSVVHRIVERGGSDAREADLVAEKLVEANLRGHDSHGVGMVPRYIDPVRAGTADNLERETAAFVDFVSASPRREGVDRIRLPGDPERETKARREVAGISIDDTTWSQIVRAGGKVGVSADELWALVSA